MAPSLVRAQYFDLGTSPASIRWNQIKSGGNRYVFDEGYQAHAVRFMHYMDTIRPHINYGFRYGPLKLPVLMQPQNFASNGLVMLAPKRMELNVIPNIDAFSEPWLKQLATHEYRHAVQFSNLNRGFIKALSYIVGQQGSLVGGALLPLWLMEGDATLAETQFSSYGRGLQPSFTIEYRAMIDQVNSVPISRIDKWFCGSFKDFTPNHYQLGYQIASYAYTSYGENIWDKVANYSAKYPFTIFTSKISLEKYYDASSNKLFRRTFADLHRFWGSLPKVENSASVIRTPITSYTTYSSPIPTSDTTVLVLKRDMDRTDRFVEVNVRTAAERTLFHTGRISTQPTMGQDGRIYWTEYRTSRLWDQRINSQLCYFDLSDEKPRTVHSQRKSLYPTSLPDRDIAVVDYDYRGRYSINLLDSLFSVKRTLCTMADTISVHGLTYDDKTNSLYYIGLSDSGMWIGTLTDDGYPQIIKSPAYITIGRLKAKDGKLYYNSIESGKDEAHMFDLAQCREYQLSESTYGSFDPAPFDGGGKIALTTYDAKGYKLSVQRLPGDSAVQREVLQTKLPQNTINPPRIKWDVPNIDAIEVDTTTTHEVKRYRKGLHLINIHSWAPLSFDPNGIIGERGINVNVGATLISQNLLNSTIAHFSYAWTDDGSTFRGGVIYNGWVPKIEVNAEYSMGGQIVTAHDDLQGEVMSPKAKGYFDISTRVYVPILLSSGYHTRYLQPSVSLSHNNALLLNPRNGEFDNMLQKLTASLQYVDNVRMADRDFQPRWGYALRASATMNPFSSMFGKLWSVYARGYLPGVALHHGVTLRTAYQSQSLGLYNFRQKELFPRGAEYDFTPRRYAAASADYQLPLWCPDMGINSVIYFKRIRANLGFDFARYQRFSGSVENIYSYGGELIFDINILRTPSLATTTFSISLFKPSDKKGPVVGVNFSIPL